MKGWLRTTVAVSAILAGAGGVADGEAAPALPQPPVLLGLAGPGAPEDGVKPSGRPTLVIGYSMGGAVAVSVADHPGVSAVVGLAPWIPSQVDVGRLRGRRLAVLHGSLDGGFLGFPGVSPESSRAGVERARALGVEASWQLIRGATHGIAFPLLGMVLPLPRAGAWLRGVDAQAARFQADVGL